MFERTFRTACALALVWGAWGCGGTNEARGTGGTGGGEPPVGGSESTGPGKGVFVWFDSAVWSASKDWFPEGSKSPCVQEIANANYLKPGSAIFADEDGTGFNNLRALVTDELDMPQGAALDAGNVFAIATSLDPTGTNEFLPWASLGVGGPGGIPECFGTVDQAKTMTYEAFYSFVKGMLNPGPVPGPATAASVPVSLMFSSFRTLRWGRILSAAQHLDSNDQRYFGGLTELGAAATAPNLAPESAAQEDELGGGRWSIHWPTNATTSTVDDVDMVMNYVNRVIDLTNYINTKGDLGANPVIDVYLDLELFQLTHVAPSGNTTSPFGTQYPGIDMMPQACLENMGWWDTNTSKPAIPTYWAVPANIADSFWRTLRQAEQLITTYNAGAKSGDVKLTLSVWSQEAYRFASPRFGIADTTTSDQSWEQTKTASAYGRFNQPFGTAQIKRRSGGTAKSPTYTISDWVCDCCRVDQSPAAPAGDKDYRSKTPMADDFTINNCIFQYADRVAYGTYQSTPVALVHPKAEWKGDPFRNNTAVDFTGPKTVAAPPPDPHTILAGQGVPLGGLKQKTRIHFGAVADFAPTAVQSNQDGLLPDGGWLLYPPNFSNAASVAWNPYYYNATSVWPPQGSGALPDWTSFDSVRTDDCTDFYGVYDMPFPGWLPFAARMLTSVDQWAVLNPNSSPPSIIMTLELTPLNSVQAGSSGEGACFKNSYGNQWTWGIESGNTTCATGETSAGKYEWPDATIDPLCQSDRVSYLFGGDAGLETAGTSDVVGNAWGLAAATRLFEATNGPSGKSLSTWLDARTPSAFNNHFSYHCLMTHEKLDGFYAKPTSYGATEPLGQRDCWSPWDNNVFAGCKSPSDVTNP